MTKRIWIAAVVFGTAVATTAVSCGAVPIDPMDNIKDTTIDDVQFPAVLPADRQFEVNSKIYEATDKLLRQAFDMKGIYAENADMIAFETDIYNAVHAEKSDVAIELFDDKMGEMCTTANLTDAERAKFMKRYNTAKTLIQMDEVRYFKYSTDKIAYDKELAKIIDDLKQSEKYNVFVEQVIDTGNLDKIAAILNQQNMNTIAQKTRTFGDRYKLYDVAQQGNDLAEHSAWLDNIKNMGFKTTEPTKPRAAIQEDNGISAVKNQ